MVMIMKTQNEIIELNKFIDFTLLDPRATKADLERLCDVAYKNQYYAVCVNSCNVEFIAGYIKKNLNDELKIVSVIGFPLRVVSIDVKVFETKLALQDGADEIDFVINVGMIKNGDWKYIKNELVKMRKVTKGYVLKCIIETCYLTDNEIIKICGLCSQVKIDYVKTSTGFGTAGATEHHVKLMVESLSKKCKVKASGGIRSREDAIRYINLGAERIGASRIL